MPRQFLAVPLLVLAPFLAPRAQRAFRVEETTIAQVHAAMRSGGLTCRTLVQAYLRRIDAYDKRGPAINAITVVNPDALAINGSRIGLYSSLAPGVRVKVVSNSWAQ